VEIIRTIFGGIEMKLKKWVSVVVLTTVLVGMTSGVNIFAADSISADGKAVVDELAKSTYAGRQAGTAGYAKAVDYLEKKMVEVGMQPILGDKQYKQSYEGGVAELTKEKVSLNGQTLEIMKDYMPFSRTISKAASFKKVYYVGAGLQSDYVGKTPGLVVFNWYDKNGKFPGGALDRIQIAVANGATGVLIVANGELAVGNYEHPLNANEITVPALYVTSAIASKMGMPSDFKAKELTGNEFAVDMTVKRAASVKTDNLIGLIPGKQESHAILWVTNIDGFGSLPDGRHFESAKAGAVSAAMMLDMAKYYSENQPEYTMLFAFVGSKWKGQEGVTALVNKLNFDHIDTTIDLYAMGGDGNSMYVGYTDSSFESTAKKIHSSAVLNPDLGNALSSVIKSKSKNILFIRDKNTWVDNSLTDTGSNVSNSAYQAGLNSLLTLSANTIKTLEVNKVIPVIPDRPVFISKTLTSPNVTLNQTETEHFIVYADDENKPLVTGAVLREMEKIYTRVNYYNYDVVPKSKAVAMFMKNGEQAAEIAGRADLIKNSESAGGGFANFVNGVLYLYIRFGTAYETVSHELNHAIASANTFFPLNSGLQEWQGQSHFVRYSGTSYNGDSKTLVDRSLHHSGDVPKLDDYIQDNAAKLDIAWFTQGKQHPIRWIYTYYLAGSMYGYLYDQYGDKVSRRAMYRNYEDVTRFKENIISDTGLTFDEFLKQWSHWMLHSGTPLSPVTADKKLLVNKNNWFDHMLLYTLNSKANSGSSVKTDSSTNSGTSTGAMQQGGNSDGTLTLKSFGTISSDLTNVSLKALQTSTEYKFTLQLKSAKERDYFVFDPPNGDKIAIQKMNGVRAGANTITFTIPKDDLKGINEITINFFGGNENNFFNFQTNQLFSVPAEATKSSTTSLASKTFKIDNTKLIITTGKSSIPLSNLKNALIIPKGSSMIVLKADGKTKISSGNVPVGAKVKVTAENGKTTKVYTIKK
jgi:hypothetical protein